MPDTSVKSYLKRPAPPSSGAAMRWPPFGPLRYEIDRLFDEFDRGFGWPSFSHSAAKLEHVPREVAVAVDVIERENAYEISAELPGLDQREVEVKVVNGFVVIKGEKKHEAEQKAKGYHLSERHYGVFERSFQIPRDVDAEKIEASFKNGVLTVTLPKSPAAQKSTKTIPIKAT